MFQRRQCNVTTVTFQPRLLFLSTHINQLFSKLPLLQKIPSFTPTVFAMQALILHNVIIIIIGKRKTLEYGSQKYKILQ